MMRMLVVQLVLLGMLGTIGTAAVGSGSNNTATVEGDGSDAISTDSIGCTVEVSDDGQADSCL